jgi:hypothetical protein
MALDGAGDCGRLAPKTGEYLLLFADATLPPNQSAPPSLVQAGIRANRELPNLEAQGGRCALGGRIDQLQPLLAQLREWQRTQR